MCSIGVDDAFYGCSSLVSGTAAGTRRWRCVVGFGFFWSVSQLTGLITGRESIGRGDLFNQLRGEGFQEEHQQRLDKARVQALVRDRPDDITTRTYTVYDGIPLGDTFTYRLGVSSSGAVNLGLSSPTGAW